VEFFFFLPERQDFKSSLKILPFRQKREMVIFRRSLTCGYENSAFQARGKKNPLNNYLKVTSKNSFFDQPKSISVDSGQFSLSRNKFLEVP
jgi:hypothetical protein